MAAKTKPLRAALIGLSSSAITSWAATAHLPNFLTATGRTKFTINALLNSSVEAAQSAIKAFNLEPTTKAYGNPEDLAADKDIDVVICNTRVDKHYETILPSIRAGKDVYVEWPIASNPTHISALVSAAKESGARVAVGLQGPWCPPGLKMREIVQSGKLGKVLSVDVRAFGGSNDREFLPPGLSYFGERAIGGNPITIGFGHLYDMLLSVTGELVPETVHAKLQLQRPEVRLLDPKTKEFVGKMRSDVPDLVSLHGAITQSSYADASATLSIRFRRGQQFPGTPALDWTINCELGEIRLLSPLGMSIQAGAYDDTLTIQVHNFSSDEVEDVHVEPTDAQKEVPFRARSVQSSLYSFADGGAEYVGLEEAAKRAAQIESFLKEWEESKH